MAECFSLFLLSRRRAEEAPPIFSWSSHFFHYTVMTSFPNVKFTHDLAANSLVNADLQFVFDPKKYLRKQVVFLMRDPRDSLVSSYYGNTRKIRPEFAEDKLLATYYLC